MRMLRFIPVILVIPALAGCQLSPEGPLGGSGSLRNILKSGSGLVHDIGTNTTAAIELGKQGIATVKETAVDLKKRADQVQDGVQKIKAGKDEVKAALTK